MKKRSLLQSIEKIAFSSHKMAFLSGPRQCGKTTLGKLIIKSRKRGKYFNWDDVEFRRLWTKNPKNIILKSDDTEIVVLDEIHKAKSWKRSLKGVYDTLTKPTDILVTGSARLNVYRKGSDSLLGRYYNFRLHPFTLREMETDKLPSPNGFIEKLFNKNFSTKRINQSHFDQIFKFGGFPQPLLEQNEKKARLWRMNRIERVIREDLRDLSRIPELSQIEMLASLLPERVGSPLSLVSLREDLEVSYDTVKRWLMLLDELYYVFRIKPYSKSIKRSLKKETKLYLWDYSEVADKGSRFENLIACHLLKTCHYWTDTGEGLFEFFYLRNKEKEEIDFLITKDKKAWLPIEVKSQNTKPVPVWNKFLDMLGCRKGIQIVLPHNIWNINSVGDNKILVASASDVLKYFA